MPVQQVFIVRRGSAECFRALQQAFGTPPVWAKITWNRRQGDRRRHVLVCSDRRRPERRRSAHSDRPGAVLSEDRGRGQ
mgnify:CR=1 FL=1